MAELEISYKGTNIVSSDGSTTKTLTTDGKYCEDDITVTLTSYMPALADIIDRSYAGTFDTRPFGNTFTTIGANAFRNCGYLERIIFSPSITSIQSNAITSVNRFEGCTFYATTPPTAASSISSGSTSSLVYSDCPADNFTAYYNATNYNNLQATLIGRKYFTAGQTISTTDTMITKWYNTPEDAVAGTNPLDSLIAAESKDYYGARS